MDIILEIADTLLLDRFYSAVLPASPAQYLHYKINDVVNTTFSSIGQAMTGAPQYDYMYEPASQFINLEPTQWTYSSSWPRDNIFRQAISLFTIVWFFGVALYFVFASLSYVYVFDKTTFQHPKYLKNQVRMEIVQANKAMPVMSLLTAGCMLAEVRGYSKLYDSLSDAPFSLYNIIQFPFFVLFTDFCIYWIHRGLHHPLVYKTLHKPHHKWIVPTPYASHAFHPLDGFAQSIPYHLFPFLFPLQKFAYIALFVFINFWTIFIHDGEYYANSPLINGAACHTMHHLYFNYNYGQFTTLWDRMGGSYRKPNDELFNKSTKVSKTEWERQTTEMEKIQEDVEGEDDRGYLASMPVESKKVQ
ncbi:c-5 sterol desaturase [Elasticomyces elasticus]|uniref:C-5 sterol desaturase n=1 Tax=Exophiala sideris TaxID=1016849 RepID=A0ABR0JLX3_9EURO|nr:c-5 sterol desaturase [Elasticomyces elasticus]KAK5036602.1 c-5 sterol desaturase [Exophiala sideris]KAK5041567.1 c-5 sterol desaturase [Exophiala sideris]KAK5066985.1 c-5 sterol desaturase [Exophiala sideris]KAK5185044.1 c-5 sterol desaturase [Eurotiomycetes sp. CCFEE 6388]